MAVGKCRFCGYAPVATDAPICPRCAGQNPNPGLLSRIGALIGGVFVLGVFGVILAFVAVAVMKK